MLILTHSGSFHADEVIGHAILTLAHPGQELRLERTRDPARWAEADIVFDVGGIYDPAVKRYDHHMTDAPLRADGTPYSSAGLLWRDFGRDAIRAVTGSESGAAVDAVWGRLDAGLILLTDKIDNGVSYPTPDALSTLIGDLNASWDEPDADEMEAFLRAAALAREALINRIRRTHAAVKARAMVEEAARTGSDPRLLELPQGMPWRDVVLELGLPVLYAILPRKNGQWTLECAPAAPKSFDLRRPLPQAWAGLTDAELQRVTGVPDAVFAHRNLFMAVAGSREGALRMAELALA
ncbi:MYG1 family protein [Azospirillum sp. SYSU D00513]|uniref:MYG1 family protein n=1 Tax=Azospirillum sp. SYSU D00513 TaxID=2812561 RepID=UPI001A95A30D|nr:MYG1 family protein [Azospirillum sp. SYSU D00513]